MVKQKKTIADRVASILKSKPKIRRTGLKFNKGIGKRFRDK